MMTRDEVATVVRAKLAYSGSAGLRERVWTDVAGVYEEAVGPSARGVDVGAGLGGMVTGRRMVRFAVVALVVCGLGVLIGYGVYQGARSQSKSPSAVGSPGSLNAQESADQRVLLNEELEHARRLF